LSRSDLDRIGGAIDGARHGQLMVIVEPKNKDEVGRAFLFVAADRVTPQLIERITRESSSALSLAMPASAWDRLGAGESVSAKIANTADWLAVQRALTVQCAIDPKRGAEDFESPGTVLALRASDRGLFARAGYAEAAVDMARMAGLNAAAVLAELAPSEHTLEGIAEACEQTLGTDAALPVVSSAELVAYRFRREAKIRRSAEASIPTEPGGEFTAIVYETEPDRAEHVALVKGDISGPEPVLIRIHSKCLTGDALGSERCDCGPQLRQAMKKIDEVGRGVLLYLDQEGRGIGLVNKLRAYALQDRGYDTVSANEQLGFAADVRDYGIAAQMLFDLGVERVRLLTNNPRKLAGLAAHGLEVVDRVPLEVAPSVHNRRYLETKREKLGHLLTSLDEG
jgi:3,4-dihydroxy 2-butanone 4-phosphate synthase/GTP cyclohydrolase II